MPIETEVLLQRAKLFFRDNIVSSHLNALENASHLKDYNVNPFLSTYLANFLEGNNDPRSIVNNLFADEITGRCHVDV